MQPREEKRSQRVVLLWNRCCSQALLCLSECGDVCARAATTAIECAVARRRQRKVRRMIVYLVLILILVFCFGSVLVDALSNARRAKTDRAKPGPYRVEIGEKSVAGISARVFQPIAVALPLPVVIYLPSWGGVRSENDVLLRDVASWGFVVLSIDDISHDEPTSDLVAVDELARTAEFGLRSSADLVALGATGRHRTRLQAAKASSVIDGLAAGDPALQLVPIDLSKIGVVGFSHGGTSAGVMLANDRRISAAVNMDGWIRETDADGTPDRPYLILFAFVERRQFPEWVWPGRYWAIEFFNLESEVLHRMEQARSAQIRILSGIVHNDFVIQDDALDYSNAPRWKLWRPWRREWMTTIEVRAVVYSQMIPFLEQNVARRAPVYAPTPPRPGFVQSVREAYGSQ